MYNINIVKKYLLLFLIIVLGFFLRVYKVDTVPSGVLVDEAALGYNAYSVFKTGFDEHKIRYPLLFKSFGDYKPPAYFYSQLPFIKLFGSNNFSLRFPSVLAGTLLILVVFFLFNNLGFGFTTSLFAAALTAFSPWTIILSRFALESNLGLLFFGIGLTFTIKYLREDKILFAILAGVFFGLSWYGYIAYRMTTGLIIFFLFFYGFYKKLKPKNLIILVGVFFITIFPLFLTVFSKSTNARFYQIGLLADKGPVMEIIESRTFCREDLPKLLCYLNSNKATVLGRILFDRYLKTFSLDYLFVGGERSSGSYGVENFGLFSFFTIPLYLLGFIALFSHKKNKFIDTLKPLIFAGLLFGAMPSSIAGLPQKVRLSPLFPFVLILIVWGFELLREKFRGNTKTFYIFLSYFLVFYLVPCFFNKFFNN
ncbi:hypothetical protein COS50_03945 [Candidatus Roizmanbacteria bacterium CG03_land_8_20_14_0_80_35_26]|uniref:ArnT-like N-terminal domain-containing protein n=1 Tax=Candidatus Roizmanbacteria bacterium CG03_land_8_20_14_0_80_35_26 TaxID=1974845 RepID=A0A2M7BVY6_9BACT|nr:MAG: hypothetical protein COS50_03945 [Candidatus Roizmanbacteria bacterium CG03_land_8_20_14_0_80_35_26]PJC81076.1 MAG: hypothetical protein CO008_00065 [Candidatus Roizmanbacteria bacterium CG_4_8_14_3_um_filter_36_12]